MRWFVDGNNVMGSVPDGWWNDPDAAAARLAQRVARWCRTHDDAVVLVFDGAPRASVSDAAGGNLEVDFAPRRGRDAADDRIVERVEATYGDEPDLVVVSADRGLVARLPPGVAVERPGRFLRRLDRSGTVGVSEASDIS